MTGYSKADQLARGPKRQRRIVDPPATARALLLFPECAACGEPATNADHVLQRGSPHFGDDVVENVVGLCGTGTSRCHGAKHGSPYTQGVMRRERESPRAIKVHTFVERRDAEWVGRRVGETLLRERPDVIDYVLRKLGPDAGRAHLERFYYIDPRRIP